MTKRKLEVGPDGMANVLVLTDPIPRQLSIVGWGANDRPAVSWKGGSPSEVLRSPPGPEAIDVGTLSLQRVQAFVSETLDAWQATLADVLRTALSPQDRAARVQALTAQAGARVAAFSVAVAPRLAQASRTYRTADLRLPTPPDASTLQGELDRRAFMAGVEQASAVAMDRVLSIMRDSGEFPSMTEGILSTFAEIGTILAGWAGAMPAGVVGVAAPEESQKAGARNSKADQERINKILSLLVELGADLPTTEKSAMSITIADLQLLATEDPQGFMTAIKSAMDTLKAKSPEVAKKFAWGDTGVEQEAPEAILAKIAGLQNGDALLSAIITAVGGVDVDAAAGQNTQVAATMRDAFGKVIASEITKNPEGKLAQAVKQLVAGSVGTAISESIKAFVNGTNADPTPFGLGEFQPGGEDDPLAVEYPTSSRPGVD